MQYFAQLSPNEIKLISGGIIPISQGHAGPTVVSGCYKPIVPPKNKGKEVEVPPPKYPPTPQ